jgi:hypothetical protein
MVWRKIFWGVAEEEIKKAVIGLGFLSDVGYLNKDF